VLQQQPEKILALYLSNLQSPDFQCKTTEANVRQSKSNLPLKKAKPFRDWNAKSPASWMLEHLAVGAGQIA